MRNQINRLRKNNRKIKIGMRGLKFSQAKKKKAGEQSMLKTKSLIMKGEVWRMDESLSKHVLLT